MEKYLNEMWKKVAEIVSESKNLEVKEWIPEKKAWE